MRVRSLLLPAAIICAVILARPLTAQSVSVRYLWKTGEALTYRTTSPDRRQYEWCSRLG